MDGLKPGRIVYYTDLEGRVHPSMVTAVHNQETGLINCSSIVDCSGSIWPRRNVAYDQTGQLSDSWAWMYEGQATRGEAVAAKASIDPRNEQAEVVMGIPDTLAIDVPAIPEPTPSSPTPAPRTRKKK